MGFFFNIKNTISKMAQKNNTCKDAVVENRTDTVKTIAENAHVYSSVVDTYDEKKQLPDKAKILSLGSKRLTLHPDLYGLIWFADGPDRNYSPNKDKTVLCKTEFFTLSYSMGSEPSAISVKLPITDPKAMDEIGRLPYFPRYDRLSPEQRGLYLRFLNNPYNTCDIGYVFMLYYGLERHLLYGDFNKAYNVILKLRQVFDNNSFLYYSSKALVLSCIIRKNTKIIDFIKTIDDKALASIDVNILLLCLLAFNIPYTASNIVIFAKTHGFTNNRYIKLHPEIFTEQLSIYLESQFGHPYVCLQDYFQDLRFINKTSLLAFANISIIENNVDIPDFLSNPDFQRICNNALGYAHESTKNILRGQRLYSPKV